MMCLIGFLLISCAREIDPDLVFANETSLLVYTNPDKVRYSDITQAATLRKGDQAWVQLVAWFHEHDAYWQLDECDGQYAKWTIQGNVLQIDIYETLICVGFNYSGDYFRQFTRSCHPDDFMFLNTLFDIQ